MTSQANKVVLLNNEEPYKTFLPAQGDVVLACVDLDDNQAHKSFLLSKAALAEQSSFFRDLFSLPPSGTAKDSSSEQEDDPIYVEESSVVVGFVLSGLFEAGKKLLFRASLDQLELARHLACKWQLESLRTTILLAFIAAYGKEYSDCSLELSVLAEAVYQGEAALQVLKFALTHNKSPSTYHAVKIHNVKIDGRLLTEFGGPTVPLQAMTEVVRMVSAKSIYLGAGW